MRPLRWTSNPLYTGPRKENFSCHANGAADYNVLHDHTLTKTAGYGALANAGDPDGDPLTVTAINGTALVDGTATITLDSGAQVIMNADGSFTYTPPAAYTTALDTPDSFTYTFTDSV